MKMVLTPICTVALAAGPGDCLANRDLAVLCGPGGDLSAVSPSQAGLLCGWLKDDMEGSLVPGRV